MNTLTQPLLIDVRTPAEYAEGHYPQALNHELGLMMEGTYPNAPKDTLIHVYCRSGGRSAMAYALLKKAGFTHVENIGAYRPE